MLYIGGDKFIREKDLIAVLDARTAQIPGIGTDGGKVKSLILAEIDGRREVICSPLSPKAVMTFKYQEAHSL